MFPRRCPVQPPTARPRAHSVMHTNFQMGPVAAATSEASSLQVVLRVPELTEIMLRTRSSHHVGGARATQMPSCITFKYHLQSTTAKAVWPNLRLRSVESKEKLCKSIFQAQADWAQITCLFWFESSLTLHRVEESKTTPMPTTPLVPEALPSMGFRKWVTTILSTTQVTQNVILLALLFVYRLKKLNPTVKGKPGSEFRLLTVALMLGNKCKFPVLEVKPGAKS